MVGTIYTKEKGQHHIASEIEIKEEITEIWNLEIDQRNNNHLWRDAIAKEMKNVRVVFDVLDDDRLPNL